MSEKPKKEIVRLTGGATIPEMQHFRHPVMDGAPVPKMQPLSSQPSNPPVNESSSPPVGAAQISTTSSTTRQEKKGGRKRGIAVSVGIGAFLPSIIFHQKEPFP